MIRIAYIQSLAFNMIYRKFTRDSVKMLLCHISNDYNDGVPYTLVIILLAIICIVETLQIILNHLFVTQNFRNFHLNQIHNNVSLLNKYLSNIYS